MIAYNTHRAGLPSQIDQYLSVIVGSIVTLHRCRLEPWEKKFLSDILPRLKYRDLTSKELDCLKTIYGRRVGVKMDSAPESSDPNLDDRSKLVESLTQSWAPAAPEPSVADHSHIRKFSFNAAAAESATRVGYVNTDEVGLTLLTKCIAEIWNSVRGRRHRSRMLVLIKWLALENKSLTEYKFGQLSDAYADCLGRPLPEIPTTEWLHLEQADIVRAVLGTNGIRLSELDPAHVQQYREAEKAEPTVEGQ